MTFKWKRANKQKQQTNGNRTIWLVFWTDTNACGFWLVKRTLGWKNFTPEELSRNQSILRFDFILQHDWSIEQCLLHIMNFFAGKRRVHVLIFSSIGWWSNWRTLAETIFQGHTKIALMILLEDYLPVALPIGLVGYKSYLPNTWE